jgi:hypothetical protein
MKTICREFSDLLKPRLWSERKTITPIVPDHNRLRWFPLALRPEMAVESLNLIERSMAPFLRPVRSSLDPALITGMKRNFSETLPKTLRNSSISLNAPQTPAFAEARRIGLIDLLKSASLREFATAVSGYELTEGAGMQLIRYRQGDYVGPHNDHHPEEPHLRDGYIDLQITLTSTGVARQYLLYEQDGFFNQSCNIGIASGVSVSMLPFWHQVTPLEVKPGREADAFRWLLLASFEIKKKAVSVSRKRR